MGLISETFGVGRSLLSSYGTVGRISRRVELYESFIKPGSLCFEIGALAGSEIRILRSLGARVVAAEPQPKFVSILETLFGEDSQVDILPVGVSSESAEEELFVDSMNPSLSRFASTVGQDKRFGMHATPTGWDQKFIVPTITLDQMIASFGLPHFLRIDALGFESEVLKGLSFAVNFISFSFSHDCPDVALHCIEQLSHFANYRFSYLKSQKSNHFDSRWLHANEMKQLIYSASGHNSCVEIFARKYVSY